MLNQHLLYQGSVIRDPIYFNYSWHLAHELIRGLVFLKKSKII